MVYRKMKFQAASRGGVRGRYRLYYCTKVKVAQGRLRRQGSAAEGMGEWRAITSGR
jgi:hypothetical protein